MSIATSLYEVSHPGETVTTPDAPPTAAAVKALEDEFEGLLRLNAQLSKAAEAAKQEKQPVKATTGPS